jgi:hypothetical protein
MQVALTRKSTNVKTGPMPVSTSSATTCPDACPLKAKACYAKASQMKFHWRHVTEGRRGTDWTTFCGHIAALPEGQLWRHNVAGDLPGENDAIDGGELFELVKANHGKRGFTYTHKPVLNHHLAGLNAWEVQQANLAGFTINLSADNLAEADEMADLAIAPVVVVLDAAEGVRHDFTTPNGRKVATCPATYRDDVTCASCGLCQRQDRKVIVGFPAHGVHKKEASAVARG